MNILQLSPYSSELTGGSQAYCFALSKMLKRNGHGVEVWTGRYPRTLSKVDYSYGFPVKRFFVASYVLQLNPAFLVISDILREIKRFDIITTHSYIFFSSNQLAFCRLLKRFPYVLHLHGGLGDLNPSLVLS